MSQLPSLAMDDPAFWQDIHTPLAEALAQGRFARTPDGGIYALGYREVDAILKDPIFEAADLLGMMGLNSGPVWEWWQRLMFSHNDPFHGRIRRLVNRAFTPRRTEQDRAMIRTIARDLVADAVARGEVDVMETLAHEMPSIVMASVLAIPESDRERFSNWTTDVGLAFGAAGDAEILARVESALANLDEYVEGLIEDRREHLGDDLLSELIMAEESGDQLSTRELIDLVENLLFAGHDTTRGSIGTLLVLLVERPEVAEEIRANPDLARNAVEEMLRFEAITFSTCRANREDVEISGVAIPAGTPVGICLPSASRDPERYDNPHVFDVHRKDPNPPTFGAGAHYCIGAALARAELQEMLLAVLDLTSSVELVEPPRWTPFAQIRRYEQLPMRFEAAGG
jgi:cytochrome P450